MPQFSPPSAIERRLARTPTHGPDGERYERWLSDDETFILLAEGPDGPVGYAFVTVGAGYAGWRTGRLAELQTLSVLSQYRGEEIGGRLLAGVWSRLEERGVDEMAITTALANVDSHRFYERHGFQSAFLLTTESERGPRGRVLRALLKRRRRQSRT